MSGENYVIAGGGQAGGCAALAMRRAGFASRILLIGEEGLLPYERPPLSKEVLTSGQVPDPAFVLKKGQCDEGRIEVVTGVRVEQLDVLNRNLTLSDGSSVPYDKLLLATGARARRMAVPGGEHVRYLRSFEDAVALRRQWRAIRSVVCIGAGVIGLEAAASARSLGLDVTVLEAGHAPMARSVPPEIGRFLSRLHRNEGVRIEYGVEVVGIEEESHGALRVVCADGRSFPAGSVTAGIGVERNCEIAARAGLDVDDGIMVDAMGRTSVDGIFAAGDVAAFWHPVYQRRMRLEAWRHAQNHGIAVARAMCGAGSPYEEVPWFWSDQFGVHLQVVGMPLDAVTTVIDGSPDAADFIAVHLDAEERVVGATAANRPRAIRGLLKSIQRRAPYDPSALSRNAAATGSARMRPRAVA